MRIIDTGITKEILSGDNHPQLKIGDKLYTVDDRQSTWDKIQSLQKEELEEKDRTKKLYDLALGRDAAEEIMTMDLPVEKSTYLNFCIMGAITGENPEELQKMAKEQSRKNS